MNKIYAFLTTVWFLVVALSANAQPTLYFSASNETPDLGEQITVDVLVDDFIDMTTYQYSVNWNPDHLSFVSVSNYNAEIGLTAGDFGTSLTDSGRLTALWADPLGTPRTLANGSVLYTITFDVVATASVSTDIEFTGNPSIIEFTQNTGGGIMDITDDVVFNDITINIDGGGAGGGLTCNFSGFGVLVESDSAETGEQVCLDVSVCNFVDIISMQYTMQFDPNILAFDNAQNFNLPGLGSANFGTTMSGNGFIVFSWNEEPAVGLTLPDETVIYTVCFTAIGPGGSIDTVKVNNSLSPVEVIDINSGGQHIGLESIDGEVKVIGEGEIGVTVIADCEIEEVGDTVYIDVSVKDFIDMGTMQYSMAWDPGIIEFYEIQLTGALPGTPIFNTSQVLVDAGKLTFLWDDPLAMGVSLTDNTVIYRVGFIVVGNAGETSTITFTDDPVDIEASRNIGGMTTEISVNDVAGCVDVIGEGLLQLTIADVVACTGDTIEVDVFVDNFNEILGMQYDVRWDENSLLFLDVIDYNLSGLSSGQFNQLNINTLRTFWTEPTLTPQTLPNGTVIYKMRFVVLGNNGSSSDIVFLDAPEGIDVELSCCTGIVINDYVLNDGTVTVDCSGGPIIVTDTLITNVLCSGDATGAIDITVSGGTGSYTYLWSNAAVTQDITGLSVGNYTVTVTSGGSSIVETYTVTEAVITSTPTDMSCNGVCDGAIDLNISGNTSGFTYAWSNSDITQDLSDLCTGNYTVTITGTNGCTKVEGPISITQPEVLATSGVVTDENGTSMNGAVDLTVSGGTTNYTYLWSNAAVTQDISGLSQGSYTVTVTDANGCEATETFIVESDMGLTVIDEVTDVSCFGGNDGAIHLDVSGGTPPYTYQWAPPLSGNTPDQTGLTAGNYTVTVSDANGLMVILNTAVGSPAALTILQTDIVDETGNGCNGSIDITVIGGTMPYTYLWSNDETSEDITDLCSGNYNVTITDDNGCIFLSNIFEVLAPQFVVATSEVTDVSCNGYDDGSVCVTVMGGTGPYEFSIPTLGVPSIISVNGDACFTDLPIGSYTVVVQDSGNPVSEITLPIVVDQPDPILVSVEEIFANTNADCTNPNGAIDISATGGTGVLSYLWSNGATVEDPTGLCHLAPENPYSVTVTDANGCTAVLEVNLGLTLELIIETPSCNGDSDGSIEVIAQGGDGNYTYAWSHDPTNQTAFAFDLAVGSYTVTVTDVSGLQAIQNIPVTEPNPIEINIIATPSNGGPTGSLEAEVQGGTAPYSYLWNDDDTQITSVAENLTAGRYAVRVEDANGCIAIAQGEVGQGDCFSAKEILSINGNGKNTEFIILCANEYDNTLKVFNRWGQLVYEAVNYDNTWSGIDLEGEEVPEGGYYYVFEYEEAGETVRLRGSITILR